MVYQNCGSMYGVKKNQLKEDLNQALRNRDKMKDDAIAQLSYQVVVLILILIPNSMMIFTKL